MGAGDGSAELTFTLANRDDTFVVTEAEAKSAGFRQIQVAVKH